MTNKESSRRKENIMMAFVLMLALAIIICAMIFSGKNNTIKPKSVPSRITKLPDSYKSAANKQGKLISFSYKIKMADAKKKEIDKRAIVYLPYGYTDNKKYDFFYLCHGYGGSENTFLGDESNPRTFKNVLDNMIMNGDIKPLIVVCPTYTDEYIDYYRKIDAMTAEIVKNLVPAVETTFNSYAKGTAGEAFVKTRSHRAIGGFSMGGCTTWRAFCNQLQYFKYYLPVSMPLYYYAKGFNEKMNRATSPLLAKRAAKSVYLKKDYAVFAASGTDDYMCAATKAVVDTLRSYTDQFTYTNKNFKYGNLMFTAFPGKHNYKDSFSSLYNGLIRFFRDEG